MGPGLRAYGYRRLARPPHTAVGVVGYRLQRPSLFLQLQRVRCDYYLKSGSAMRRKSARRPSYSVVAFCGSPACRPLSNNFVRIKVSHYAS